MASYQDVAQSKLPSRCPTISLDVNLASPIRFVARQPHGKVVVGDLEVVEIARVPRLRPLRAAVTGEGNLPDLRQRRRRIGAGVRRPQRG